MSCDSRMFITKQAENHFNPFTAVPFFSDSGFMKLDSRFLKSIAKTIQKTSTLFLREIISNASDAIDKLYFKSLTDTSVGMKKSDFAINIAIDKENRTLTVSDNGIGMTEEDLENNLGTIANSGSFAFKKDNDLWGRC